MRCSPKTHQPLPTISISSPLPACLEEPYEHNQCKLPAQLSQLISGWQNWCSKMLSGSQTSHRFTFFILIFHFLPDHTFISSSQHEARTSSLLFISWGRSKHHGHVAVQGGILGSGVLLLSSLLLCHCCRLAKCQVPGHGLGCTMSQKPFPEEKVEDAICL